MLYAKLENDIIKSTSTNKVDGWVDVTKLGEYVKLGKSLWDCWKVKFKKDLWALLPKKVKEAKKIIIGKPDMSDDELKVQLELYRKKYDDAKAGLDVFEGQALAKGITQEEFRQLVVQKGDNFLFGEKVIDDRIELVRSSMEDKIDAISDTIDVDNVKNKFTIIDTFTINTSAQEMLNELNKK